MGRKSFNLAIGYILEIVALIVIGYWGWAQHQGVLRYALALSLPVIVTVIWTTFRVPGGTNRFPTFIAVPRLARVLLEVAFFGFAVWSLFNAGLTAGGWLLGGTFLFYHLIS
jgi:hypothetical protein